MKTNLLSAKATLLTIFLLFGISCISIASSFVASFSGNWSSGTNWNGNAPGFNVTSANNVVIPAGITLIMDSDLIIEGDLTLDGGTLNLNGHNLAINGAIITTGLGSVIGNKNSDIAFNGYGGAGNMVFSPGSQMINNLTINIGSNNGVYLGSDLTVCGTLSLLNGSIGIGNNNLVISEKGTVQGGSPSSYVLNTGTGSLSMAIANTGAACTFQVGTQNGYAPVTVTNNSTAPGTFSVYAFEGVLSDGITGNDISGSENVVNTSWNVSSSIAIDANVNLEMFWNSRMQVNGFNNTQAYLSQYTSSGWNTNGYTTAMANGNGSFSLAMTGVTSFGQFAVFGKNATTAINHVTENASMSLYPNPAANYINISLAQTGNYPIVKIIDVQGKEVISQQIENSVTSLDINTLSKGVYFASLDGTVTKKFIKE